MISKYFEFFYEFEKNSRSWNTLSEMDRPRSNHACEILQYDSRSFLFVFGGTFVNVPLDVVEIFDLENRSGQWSIFQSKLPTVLGRISGFVVRDFGLYSCDAIFVDTDLMKVYVCTSNFHWTIRSVEGFLSNSTTNMFTLDASFFYPEDPYTL